jgi:hypothetical protein
MRIDPRARPKTASRLLQRRKRCAKTLLCGSERGSHDDLEQLLLAVGTPKAIEILIGDRVRSRTNLLNQSRHGLGRTTLGDGLTKGRRSCAGTTHYS